MSATPLPTAPPTAGTGSVRYGLFAPNAPNLIAPELFDGSGRATMDSLRGLEFEQRVRPDAILVISPHFLGRHQFLVQISPRPPCLHDFGGFDPRLYDRSYNPPGWPALGAALIQAGEKAGVPVQSTTGHGLDHGAWTPLLHLAPSAQIPVVPLSIAGLGPLTSMEWGRAIATGVRDFGCRVAVIATGSILHRLDRFDPDSTERWEDGAHAEEELVGDLLAGDVGKVAHFDPAKWRMLAPEGDLEPLFILLGALGPGYHARLVSTEQAFGAVGFCVLEFEPAPAATGR